MRLVCDMPKRIQLLPASMTRKVMLTEHLEVVWYPILYEWPREAEQGYPYIIQKNVVKKSFFRDFRKFNAKISKKMKHFFEIFENLMLKFPKN